MKMCAQDIEFTLIRSERKTADIVIERSGEVIVRAPHEIDDERLREAVADRALCAQKPPHILTAGTASLPPDCLSFPRVSPRRNCLRGVSQVAPLADGSSTSGGPAAT
jgi:hypothetical protein